MYFIEHRPENSIIFTIGRMNPPTPGHLVVIRNLIIEGVKKNTNVVFVILSKTNDNNKDPLSCYTKKYILNAMIINLKTIMISETVDKTTRDKIQDMQVETICVSDVKDASEFTTIISIINSEMFKTVPDINLFLIVGEERINIVDLVTDFTYTVPNVYSVDYKLMSRENMVNVKNLSEDQEELCKMDMKMINPSDLSASFVRNVVKHCPPEKLIELYDSYLNDNQIRELYHDTYDGITNLPSKVKNEDAVKPLKYDYPQIKGDMRLQNTSIFLLLILFLALCLILILFFGFNFTSVLFFKSSNRKNKK